MEKDVIWGKAKLQALTRGQQVWVLILPSSHRMACHGLGAAGPSVWRGIPLERPSPLWICRFRGWAWERQPCGGNGCLGCLVIMQSKSGVLTGKTSCPAPPGLWWEPLGYFNTLFIPGDRKFHSFRRLSFDFSLLYERNIGDLVSAELSCQLIVNSQVFPSDSWGFWYTWHCKEVICPFPWLLSESWVCLFYA